MQRAARFGTSAAGALFITFALFFLMQALIQTAGKTKLDEGERRNIEMVKVDREEDIQRKERVERPPEQVKPPELEMPTVSAAAINKTVFNFDLRASTQSVQGTGISTGDGDFLPIVKVDPIYPRRALEQGIEGYVIVQYIVTTQGTTRDVFVVEADPRGYFEREAIKAAEKYKYKPRIINGEAVEVPVKTRIDFKLSENE